MANLAYSTANNAVDSFTRGHQVTTLQSYANNLLHAVRLLWGALLARKPAQVERRLSRREKMRAILAVSDMAREVEASMPALAAELRYLAAHR